MPRQFDHQGGDVNCRSLNATATTSCGDKHTTPLPTPALLPPLHFFFLLPFILLLHPSSSSFFLSSSSPPSVLSLPTDLFLIILCSLLSV